MADMTWRPDSQADLAQLEDIASGRLREPITQWAMVLNEITARIWHLNARPAESQAIGPLLKALQWTYSDYYYPETGLTAETWLAPWWIRDLLAQMFRIPVGDEEETAFRPERRVIREILRTHLSITRRYPASPRLIEQSRAAFYRHLDSAQAPFLVDLREHVYGPEGGDTGAVLVPALEYAKVFSGNDEDSEWDGDPEWFFGSHFLEFIQGICQQFRQQELADTEEE